jgi:hypothetical protein
VHDDRVAGYFRSTSIATASQGFSAFVGRQGQTRLIVGADLHPDDVRAILQCDEDRPQPWELRKPGAIPSPACKT